MKVQPQERLSEYLFSLEETVLSSAYSVDNAEKMRAYCKNKRACGGIFSQGRSYLRRAAAFAAGFLLLLGAVIYAPAILFPARKSQEGLPPWMQEEMPIHIKSIDMLNYYSAVRVLSDHSDFAGQGEKNEKEALFLEENDSFFRGYGLIGANAERGLVGTVGEEETIFWYELDPHERFSVSKVIYFRIELSDPKGFLATRLGTGTVDVVITENSLETMITFRSGDRYYSCCLNGVDYQEGKWFFSTHKYVESFFIVKNMAQENYRFTVTINRSGRVESLRCQPYHHEGSGSDEKIAVIGETYTVESHASFTVAELEEYFNGSKLPEETEEPSSPQPSPEILPSKGVEYYTDGVFVFELREDNSFFYYSEKNPAAYRKGIYSRGCDAVEFRFMQDGVTVETVSCDYIHPLSFRYNGSEYTKEPFSEEAL